MQTVLAKPTQHTIPENTTPNHPPAASQEMADVEGLIRELKQLLVRHESALNEEGIRQEVEILERWVESYRRGLAAANKIAKTGIEWLPTLRDRLKMATDEMQRLEGEGGNPASKEQMQKTEDLLNAAKRIDEVLPTFRQMFASEKEELDA